MSGRIIRKNRGPGIGWQWGTYEKGKWTPIEHIEEESSDEEEEEEEKEKMETQQQPIVVHNHFHGPVTYNFNAPSTASGNVNVSVPSKSLGKRKAEAVDEEEEEDEEEKDDEEEEEEDEDEDEDEEEEEEEVEIATGVPVDEISYADAELAVEKAFSRVAQPKITLGKWAKEGSRTKVSEEMLAQMPTPTPKVTIPFSDVAHILPKFERGKKKDFRKFPIMLAFILASNAPWIAEAAMKRWCGIHCEVSAAEITKRVNGTKRGKNSTKNDWNEKSKRGAVVRSENKFTRGYYNKHLKRHQWMFQHIKENAHDKRYLGIAGTEGIVVFDGSNLKVGSSGKKTKSLGGVIEWNATRGVTNAHTALDQVISKKTEQGLYVTTIRYADPFYADLFAMRTPADAAFQGTPLHELSGQMCGLVVEAILQHVAPSVFGAPITRSKKIEKCRNGAKRGANSTSYDFDLLRFALEAKFSTMTWNKSQRRWEVQFQSIKFGKHKLLVLVLHAPDGLHIIAHKGGENGVGVHGNGKAEKTEGKVIKMLAPADMTDPEEAKEAILKKFWHGGCTYIGLVAF